jgi:hypothetical protein
MGTIYEIICWTTGLRYVGQTTRTKELRLQQHEYSFRKGDNHTHSVFEVLEHGNYEIYELEKVEDDSKLSEREHYYIQHTDCVNFRYGTFDIKTWWKENYQNNKEKAKEYYEANRQDISEKGKKKYTCECGSTLRKRDKARHEKTQTHQNYLKNNM